MSEYIACDWRGCSKKTNLSSSHITISTNRIWIELKSIGSYSQHLCPEHGAMIREAIEEGLDIKVTALVSPKPIEGLTKEQWKDIAEGGQY